MATTTEPPKTDPRRWARTVVSKNGNFTRNPTCKFNTSSRKLAKTSRPNAQITHPKCFIKISGSRYNGTFLLNINEDLDNAIYHTMREIEVALDEQLDPLSKPRVSPKNCLSSVFRCFGANDLNSRAVCAKKKCAKPSTKPTACSLNATINQSELGHLIGLVQPKSPTETPENNKETVMKEVVNVFRTTLDQICLSDKANLEVIQSNPISTPTTPASALNNVPELHRYDQTPQSSKEQKKVSFIKFSKEEVLVIQPPKPSNNDSHELEVGIEVKPKVTTANVEQSIKLAKDRVSIGIQDGTGVLQISESAPTRTLQMVIGEGLNGRPSMKLSLNEGGSSKVPENGTIVVEKLPRNNGNRAEVYHDRADHKIENIHKPDHCNKTKRFKSVESQVSWASLGLFGLLKYDKQMNEPKCKSTQYYSNDTCHSETTRQCFLEKTGAKPGPIVETTLVNINDRPDASQTTVVESSRFKKSFETSEPPASQLNRTPCLVNTLYDPHSLDTSSYFVTNTDKSSSYNNSTITVPLPKRIKISQNHGKKCHKFSAFPKATVPSRRTEMFRNIRDIKKEISSPLIKKRDSKSTKDEFEQILRKMCGSSYLYHEAEPVTLAERCTGCVEERGRKLRPSSMWFDQWAQTENSNAECGISFNVIRNNQRVNEKKVGPDEPIQLEFAKHRRAQEETNDVGSADESMTSSEPEEGMSNLSSTDNSNTEEVSSVIETPSKKRPKEKCRHAKKTFINAKAKSFVGQQIFAALEDRTSIPRMDGLLKSHMSENQASKRERTHPLQPENNVALVNVAFCDNPSIPVMTIPPPPNICIGRMNDPGITPNCKPSPVPGDTKESDPQCGSDRTVEHKSTCKPFLPNRIKSKSCQNMAVGLSRSKPTDEIRRPITAQIKTKRLRFPHSTIARCQQLPLSVCGILNLNLDGVTSMDNRVIGTDEINSSVNHNLPQAIQALLLPEHKSRLLNPGQVSTFYCNHYENVNLTGMWNVETIGSMDNWSNCQPMFEPSASVSFRMNLFQRTFVTIKTAVSKRFHHIVQKLSSIDLVKKKRNAMKNEGSAYVAVPLRKKRDNMHLCKQKY